MSLQLWGALLGGLAGGGLVLVAARVLRLRRADLATRVLPYVRDLPQVDRRTPDGPVRSSAARGVFGPVLRGAADELERILGGETSVRRRLERAGLDKTVHDFRVEQVLWGLVGFVAAAVVSVLETLANPSGSLALVVFCMVAFASGVLLCDNRLSARVRERERQMLLEFPVVAELLALAVAAGEGPVGALDRVVRRSRGALSQELGRVLAEVRTGVPVHEAFDALARRAGPPLVARFAEAVAVAVERGTPLAAVLHAQAGDVREAGRRELIESGARKEVLMMVPVVFLVLPVTVVFAFWPGVMGLRIVTP
jgi:tight adherence protein C